MAWTKKNPRDLEGEPQLAIAAALRYLGRREYTAAELSARLRARGADAASIAAALRYTAERGYQDDARAALGHIRARLQASPRGRALLLRELKQRGVSAALAAQLLDEHYPPEAEAAALRRLAEKEPDKLKMARKLAARGFDRYLIGEWIDDGGIE